VQTVSELATLDLGKSLLHYLEALAEFERKAQETESAQACADLAVLLSTADEYARLVNSVQVSAMTALITRATHADWFSPQVAFSSRVRMYHAWQSAEAELRRLKQSHERNCTQGKVVNDCLGRSYSQIGEGHLSPSLPCWPWTFCLSNRCCVLRVGGETGAGCEARI